MDPQMKMNMWSMNCDHRTLPCDARRPPRPSQSETEPVTLLAPSVEAITVSLSVIATAEGYRIEAGPRFIEGCLASRRTVLVCALAAIQRDEGFANGLTLDLGELEDLVDMPLTKEALYSALNSLALQNVRYTVGGHQLPGATEKLKEDMKSLLALRMQRPRAQRD